VASYDKAIEFKPDSAEVYNNRGNALKELNQLDAAVASYDKAIELKPGYAEAHNNRGNVLLELKQLEAAVVSYDKAIEFKPDSAEVYNNRGTALKDINQLGAAVASYDKAIELKPDYADAYNNRGIALVAINQLGAAVDSYERALSLKPDYEYLLGTLLHTRMQLCDWQEFDERVGELIHRIHANHRSATSFSVLSLSGSLSVQRKAAEILCAGAVRGTSTQGSGWRMCRVTSSCTLRCRHS
jgi:tetratricopeptide (TPR) repeat protein